MDYLDRKLAEAKKGDADAQIFIGVHLCLNSNEKNKFQSGINWLEKAAKTNCEAQYILSKIFSLKLNDFPSAYKWLKKAAEFKHLQAIFDMGMYHHLGLGVKQDRNLAMTWYKKAALKNHSVAQYNIGLLYYEQSNYKEAFSWFQLSADNNYADANYALGNMYQLGQGTHTHLAQAISYYEKAAVCGRADVCHLLVTIYADEKYGLMDDEKALEWALVGADKNDGLSAELAGIMFYDGKGCDMDYSQAYKCFIIAANLGQLSACIELSHMLVNGEGTQKDTVAAEKWMCKAVYGGMTDAQFLLDKLREINGKKNRAAIQIGSNVDSIGYSLGGTTETGLALKEQQEAIDYARQRKERETIIMAASARTPGVSYADVDFGVVFSENGDIAQIVDEKTGVILNAGGKAAYYDAKSRTTYDSVDGSISQYDDKTKTSYNFKTSEISLHGGGFTHKV